MIDLTRDGPIARVTLKRPEVHNAFDGPMVAALRGAFDDLKRDEAVRVIVLAGEGKSFSAGGDLEWMRRTIHFSYEENREDARAMSAMFRAIATCPKPVVARVHGAALGGGAGLVAAADIAIAVESAVFGFTEVRLGVVPAVISPWVVARVGPGRAREYLTTGERFPAARAREIGLIHGVESDIDSLDAAVRAKTEAILAAAPGAVARTKQLIAEVLERPLEDAIEHAAGVLAEARTGREGQAGMTAFLERRKPPWAKA